MPTTPRPDSSERKLVGAGVFLGLILLTWLGWGTLKSPGVARKNEAPSQSTSSSTASKNPSISRSRMIEADPAETQLAAKDNAATDWRKAFALMEKLTKREKEIIADRPPPKPPATDAEIADLLAKIEPIITLLRKGAGKPGCDWGIRSLSASTRLSHLEKAQKLAKLALWDSSQRIELETANAPLNLIALDRLGNSLQTALVGGLVNLTIHQMMFKFMGESAAALGSDGRQAVQSAFDQQAFYQSLQEGLRSESDFAINTLQSYQSGQHGDGTPLSDQEKEYMKTAYENSPSQLQDSLDVYQKMAGSFDQILFWSDEKYASWMNDFQRKLPSADSESFPVYGKVREKMRQSIVTQTMVKTGLNVMDGGVAVLQQMPDPLTGKPFSYRVVDENGSFELQSEVVNKGNPVTLTFKMPPRN